MKKIIFLISLISAFNLAAQTTSSGPGSAIDSSNNPSGQAFGGALGGGNVPAASRPTSPANTATSPSVNRDLSVPRGNELPQQRMEDRSNFSGGSLGGDTTRSPATTVPPANTYPADTPVAPSVPQSGVELPRVDGAPIPAGAGAGSNTWNTGP